MRLLHLLLIFLVFVKILLSCGCNAADENEDSIIQKKSNDSADYDLDHPAIVKLPHELDEISGITYYAKDTSLFAVIDEAGILYKIYLNRNYQIKSWYFDKKHDYEDIVLYDSVFYILISNGNIGKLKFAGDSILISKGRFPDADDLYNEFETLYFDDKKGLVLICKQCETDKKKKISAHGYNPVTNTYTSLFIVNASSVDEKGGKQKIRLKPSAAAINPVTNELYIICSANRALLITDRDGNFKNMYTLNSTIYKQPEGIAFLPNGDMVISNEVNQQGSPTLLILKRKSKN